MDQSKTNFEFLTGKLKENSDVLKYLKSVDLKSPIANFKFNQLNRQEASINLLTLTSDELYIVLSHLLMKLHFDNNTFNVMEDFSRKSMLLGVETQLWINDTMTLIERKKLEEKIHIINGELAISKNLLDEKIVRSMDIADQTERLKNI